MPYDDRIENVLQLLTPVRETYRSALRLAIEQVRGYLAACREGSEEMAQRAEVELGEFARGRIDAAKFAAQFLASEAPPLQSVRGVERALAVLESIDAAGDEIFVTRVEKGEDLRAAVDAALGRAGRAFGAARIVDLARTGRYISGEHDSLLERFPFRSWNRAERRLAPPLVIEVDGTDLVAPSIADFLDGSVKLILIVDGAAAPAPLARLITPGAFVLQATSIEQLPPATSAAVPTVAALLPKGAAEFTHDPAAGRHVWERMKMTYKPAVPPRRAIGGTSAAQQAEELELLEQISKAPAVPAPAAVASSQSTAANAEPVSDAPPSPLADPVDRLAAWLLQQAGGN
jgi:hypothetical protein